MKLLRSSTVEPVFGSLINYTGLRRLNTKGLEQANKCMLMAATAYNLKKLLKYNFKHLKKAQTEIENRLNKLSDSLFSQNEWRYVVNLITTF